MLKMRYIFPLLFIFLLNWGASLLAQDDLKYKDIFNALKTATKEDIFPLLNAYQGKNPYFANTYYQLGLINEDWARGYDPLTEHEQVDYFIYNTKLYFGLAKHYLDEKQARRYKEYFNKTKPAAGKTEPGFKEIQDDISEHLKNIAIYQTHVNLSYISFTQSVSHYNKCIGLFMNICGTQKMLKEIYLTANDSLIQQTRSLQQDFDSALFYFAKFRLELDSFPLKNYKQHYQLKSIETYRLDGLTGSDFTRDTIMIWNYKEWVMNLNQILTTEIKDLRTRIDSTNQKLDKAILFFLKNPDWMGTGFHSPEIDPIIKNKLVKIDFGSTVLQLINYKENLLKFLSLSRDSINSPPDSSKQIPLLRKSRYYQDLVTHKLIVDSMLVAFSSSAIDPNIKKYARFFASNFPGNDALKNFTANQVKNNSGILDTAFENLREYLLYKQKNINSSVNLIWKKTSISPIAIHAGQADPLLTDHYQTYVAKTDKSGNLFLAGSFMQANKRPVAFIAYAEKAKTINWLKTYDLSENGMAFFNYTLNLELSSNGCYAVVSSLLPGIDSITVNNTLIRLDSKGNELLRQKNRSGSLMRWLLFDDINNKLFAAFQGKKVSFSETGREELCVSSMDSIGNSYWNYTTNLEGQVSDIIRMDANWLILCNASGYSMDSKWITVKDAKDQSSSGILSILIDASGKYLQTQQYKQCNPAEIEKPVKINSEILNILGFRNKDKTNPGSPGGNPGKLVYLLVDKKGNPFYEYY
jgi:hypothetical protein